MNFSALLRLLSDNLGDTLFTPNRVHDVASVTGARLPLLTAAVEKLHQESGKAPMVLLVVSTTREEERLIPALNSLMPQAQVESFGAWETLPHERQSPSAETVGQRYEALQRLATWQQSEKTEPFFLVASARAALQKVGAALINTKPIELSLGGRGLELEDLVKQLETFGYSRVDLVSRRGEYAVRGGIVDIFGSAAERAIRVDFFGDEIDSLKNFDVSDQRTIDEPILTQVIFPSREFLIDEAATVKAENLLSTLPALSDLLQKVAEGIMADGYESLAELLDLEQMSLADALPEGAVLAVLEPERVQTRIHSLIETDREFYAAAWDNAAGTEDEERAREIVPIPNLSGFLTLEELFNDTFSERYNFRDFMVLSDGSAAEEPDSSRTPLHTDPETFIDIDDIAEMVGRPIPNVKGIVDGGFEYVRSRIAKGSTVILTGGSLGILDRTMQLLSERNIAAEMVETLPEPLPKRSVYLIRAELEQGFELDMPAVSVLTEADLFGVANTFQRRERRTKHRGKNRVDPLQLQAGDYVVHSTHGVGRFIELTKRKIKIGGRNPQTSDREYLVLEYAPRKRGTPTDKLYVPTDQLDLLSRYMGGENPQLNKMGGSDWQAAKSRARKAVRELAVDLVKLYSARVSSKGHAFSPDTPWQLEMEDAFGYIETEDQLTAIADVKADMEREVPMDRLILGDVGYGKTEIAIRAAFKAVQDGKQVVMLVPTTLLVRQHAETFQERFAGFPIQVRQLSRFQTKKQADETIAGLADGTVDVVIGTHRLLGKGISFRSLGLVIIDEEQRFGVDHKEALKALKTNVDLLSMSATPIPRTLEMAITGIREMSTLNTAPEDRHPILTFVGPRNNGQLAAAIRRELLREGQVFFVHNRVSSINRVAAELQELVPEARIGVAHGKLTENQLEQVIVDFWENKYDVLVCTTIIETGIDIPNANTLIIDEANKYGLSQLHQIRGRVGRGRERAYAYFLFDEGKNLSETAYERLSTIASNNELGAGMQVAMKDLELRGAGDLLGAEQSGHIAGVGFDLYLRMIGEAVDVFRGETVEEKPDTRIEVPVRAFIPESYLESERLRLEAYQKISNAASHSDLSALAAVHDELVDRYGALPDQALNLFSLAALRQQAEQAGLTEVITIGGNQLRLSPVQLADSRKLRLARLYPEARYVESLGTITVKLPETSGTHLGSSLGENRTNASAQDAQAEVDLINWVQSLIQTMLLD